MQIGGIYFTSRGFFQSAALPTPRRADLSIPNTFIFALYLWISASLVFPISEIYKEGILLFSFYALRTIYMLMILFAVFSVARTEERYSNKAALSRHTRTSWHFLGLAHRTYPFIWTDPIMDYPVTYAWDGYVRLCFCLPLTSLLLHRPWLVPQARFVKCCFSRLCRDDFSYFGFSLDQRQAWVMPREVS